LLAFIKNYNLEVIKKKLLILYVLNVTDIIFTLILLSTGFYMEANTLMADVVQNPLTSLALKTILPAALLLFIYIRMAKATDNQLKQSNFILNIAAAGYALINVSHLVWFAILPILVSLY
jgi:hypothetical protein